MAISTEGADEYFAVGNHTAAQIWLKYTDSARAGAIATAKRQFARALGRALREDEPPYEDGQRIREEFAAYEQALYLLRGSAYGDGNADDALAVLQGADDAATRAASGTRREEWSRDALKWLGWGGVTLIRG